MAKLAKPAVPGQMSDERELAEDADTFVHLPHTFRQKTYFLPKYCSICGGVLLGAAFKCDDCGMRCHLGYGKNAHQDCHAEALLTTCEESSPIAQGSYKFGDLTAQKVRDARSRARRLVVSEVVKEAEEFGNLEMVKKFIAKFKSVWGTTEQVTWYVFGLQLATAALAACLSYSAVVWCAEPRSPVAHPLGAMQAASSAAALLSLEGAVAAGAYVLAVKVKRHAGILHVFIHDITTIDIQDLGVNLQHGARAAGEVASSTLSVTALLLVAALGAWLHCLRAVAQAGLAKS